MWDSLASCFKNDLGGSQCRRMANGHKTTLHSRGCGDLCCASRQRELRLPRQRVCNFNLFPVHTVSPACAERLHRRLLRRKTTRQALHIIIRTPRISQFRFRKNAINEGRIVGRDVVPEPRYLYVIDSDTDDHNYWDTLLTFMLVRIASVGPIRLSDTPGPCVRRVRRCQVSILGFGPQGWNNTDEAQILPLPRSDPIVALLFQESHDKSDRHGYDDRSIDRQNSSELFDLRLKLSKCDRTAAEPCDVFQRYARPWSRFLYAIF
jgi:hypothetical protein